MQATKLRHVIIGLLAATAAVGPAWSESSGSLAAQFQDPPESARPRVWWHWMNGNITKDGIAKDLAWMKRVGIGGAQTFDANLATPQIVPRRLVYMTPEWKDAFRFAAATAQADGLELAIAGSPGWSETGGPWVPPKDAMKKIAWSETIVQGGHRLRARLPKPPVTIGPFQDSATFDPFASLSTAPAKATPNYYSDAAVFAYRIPASDTGMAPVPAITLGDGKPLDAQLLTDGRYGASLNVPLGNSQSATTINIDFRSPQTERSLTFFSPGLSGATAAPRLEASEDGKTWRKLADIAISPVPTTISFAPVTAQYFRVILATRPAAPASWIAPINSGVDMSLASLFSPSQSKAAIAEMRLSPEARINRFEEKAGFALVPDYYALDKGTDPTAAGVDPGGVVDLTRRMKSDGTLDWTPPPGTWRIVRMGYSLTGTTNHPASPEATGLEVDKLDGSAVRRYLEHYLSLYRDAAGPGLLGPRGVRAMVTDSTEVGAFNWTPRMIEDFRRLRGYDPRPWLPTLTGEIVGSAAQSDKFLYDFRRTIADLHASQHYGTIAEVAHEHGLKLYGEALESGRPSLGDDMDMRRFTDVPMSALWSYARNAGPQTVYLADMRGAASVAHLWGQNLVAAESMTSIFAPWAYAPADLRRIIDLEFASGVNRPVIHTSVHQPVDDKQPGLSLFIFGQFFNRHETWAEMAKPWIDYIARNAYLLQQGRFVADVGYFYGEEAPLVAQTMDHYFSDVPGRYGYDFVNSTALTHLLKVQDGDLVAPSGARYRLLYLGGDSERMTLATLRRIASLAAAGATIVGKPPVGSPSLKDSSRDYRALVNRLWSGRPVTKVGKGRVFASNDVESALAQIGVAPDFELDEAPADSKVLFVHRKLADGDIYFVDNRNDTPLRVQARFRVTGKEPQIWRADTGKAEPVSYRIEQGSTVVPLSFDPEESFFVMFRTPATAESRTVAPPALVEAASLDGPWAVRFQPGRGAPPAITLAHLDSLTQQPDPGVKYFSGVATYTTSFTAPAGFRPGQPLLLDLGKVGDVANVKVNGQSIGTSWHAPFRLDIGSAVRAGVNQLEVQVADLWVNRLIGDKQPGATKITFTTIPTYKADAPLRPSGLIGPVELLSESPTNGRG